MTLKWYLKKKKVDQIEDDEQFCEAEYDAVFEYCKGQKFIIKVDDYLTIIKRGLSDSYDEMKLEYVKDLWGEFGDVPMNPETECIEEEWNGFEIGTHREDIWHWFEETYNVSVAVDLMGMGMEGANYV